MMNTTRKMTMMMSRILPRLRYYTTNANSGTQLGYTVRSKPAQAPLSLQKTLDISALKEPLILYRHPQPEFFNKVYYLSGGFILFWGWYAAVFIQDIRLKEKLKVEAERETNGAEKVIGLNQLTEGENKKLIETAAIVTGLTLTFIGALHRFAGLNVRLLKLNPQNKKVTVTNCKLIGKKEKTYELSQVFMKERLLNSINGSGAKSNPSNAGFLEGLKGENADFLSLYVEKGATYRLDRHGYFLDKALMDKLFHRDVK